MERREIFKENFESSFTWIEGFMRNVRRYGDHTAIFTPATGERLSYRQLNARVNRLANALLECGLQKGDVITAIDGKKITKMAELQEYLANKRPGDKVTITYLRDKKSKTATLTLKNQQGNTSIVKHADLDVLGGNFRDINDSEKKQLNLSTGLVVMKINTGALKDAGISRGFIIQKVNDTPMKTIDDLQKAVKDASTSKDPVLYIQGIYPTGKKDYFAVPLQE